jgi:hypothetical protein
MKYIVLLLALLVARKSKAQTTSTYLTDISGLKQILQKMPSYKDQIKGQSLVTYNELIKALERDTVNDPSSYKYFYNLSRLLFPIRDNHLGFYQTRNIVSEEDYPHFQGNIDSLSKVLALRPIDSIEGVYFYDDFYSVGLFKSCDNEYVGVVLQSKTPVWKSGQIAIHLYEFMPGYYKAVYSHPTNKTYILYPVEKYTNYSLVNSYFYLAGSEKVYSKVKQLQDNVNLPRCIYDFHFRSIDPQTQYLHIKHFSAATVAMQKSQLFFDSIKNALTAPNLILDLRNNEGGAAKASNKFYKLLKKYMRRGRVYVLVNNGTMSRGEIFTLQLKQLKNVVVLGQTSKGTLAYGSNFGKTILLPSKAFAIYPTDMSGNKKLVPYENYGVKPDIILNHSEDWIEQTLKIIKGNWSQ